MAAVYSVNLKFNAGNTGVAHNVFYMQYTNLGQPPDAGVLNMAQSWLNRVYAPLRNFMSTSYVSQGARVDLLDADGRIDRHIGTVSVVATGNSGNDPNSGPTSMSGLARTGIPKVRGGKRFPGIIDTKVAGLLLTNDAVGAMAQAVAEWLVADTSFPFGYQSGVWSTRENMFIPFSASGMVTNVPGTQVTRKPFRGA